MARWRLTIAHYLPVPDTEFEYKETSRETGRQKVMRYPVPMYLDPDDPSCHTPMGSGQCVVCHEGKGHPTDWIFSGDPTPEMEPLDAEAEALTDARRPFWSHPIDSLPGQGYSDNVLASLEKSIAALVAGQSRQPVAVAGISLEDFTALQKQVAELVAQNAALRAKPSAAETLVRRG